MCYSNACLSPFHRAMVDVWKGRKLIYNEQTGKCCYWISCHFATRVASNCLSHLPYILELSARVKLILVQYQPNAAHCPHRYLLYNTALTGDGTVLISYGRVTQLDKYSFNDRYRYSLWRNRVAHVLLKIYIVEIHYANALLILFFAYL